MEQNKLIFACDYEGTYHLRTGHPERSEVEAVRKFRRAGNLFGIVTEMDVFEAWAGHGEYEAEFDFIICSTGAGIITRTPVGDPMGHLAKLLPCDGANPYFLGELYDLFLSVGMSYMCADTPGFKSGDSEAKRCTREFDPSIGFGCYMHYWTGGGNYCHGEVNKSAFEFIQPFTQTRAVFKNSITAEGVASEINHRYSGKLRSYSVGNSAIVIPAATNKAAGITRFAKYAGIPLKNVWSFGDGTEDVCMLKEFNGIAKSDGHPAVLAATDRVASSVAEAIEIIMKETNKG